MTTTQTTTPTVVRVRHQSAPQPNACRWCGHPSNNHGSRYSPNAGQHRYTLPTNAQRLARMRARRAAR